MDSGGGLFFSDRNNSVVRRVSGGTITTVAGNGVYNDTGDGGPATSASMRSPTGVAVDAGGNLFIVDANSNRVRKVSGGTITAVAGDGTFGYGGDGGAATSASLKFRTGIALDALGNLYIADTSNCRIRNVSGGGTITTVAGNGTCDYSGDTGSPTAAHLNFPYGVAVDSSGSLAIADTQNCRVRKVTAGTITTITGDGTCTYGGDSGVATSAQVNFPSGVEFDASGNVYIADTDNCRARKVASGNITTFAGNGFCVYSGDGGPATNAAMYSPQGVAVDSGGNLYIADYNNCRVRQVNLSGTITTIAGTGVCNYGGDGGPATSAQLNYPSAVALDVAGALYIADTYNCRIRKVTGGTITTTVGTGACAYGGDNGAAAPGLAAVARAEQRAVAGEHEDVVLAGSPDGGEISGVPRRGSEPAGPRCGDARFPAPLASSGVRHAARGGAGRRARAGRPAHRS